MPIAITPDLEALLEHLQVGPDKPQGEIEIDHVLPAVAPTPPTIVQMSNVFTTAGASRYQHCGAATTPGATRVLIWIGLWRQLTSSPQPPGDGETWEAIEVAHFYDDHDAPDPCELSAYKAHVTIAQANHLLQHSTGGDGTGVLIRATMWELLDADYDSITSITLQDQAAATVLDVGSLGVLDVGKLALLAVGSGDDLGLLMGQAYPGTMDPRQWTVDHFADRDGSAGASNTLAATAFPVGWWGHRFGDGSTSVEARVDYVNSHTWGGLAIVVGPDAAHVGSDPEVVTTTFQTSRMAIDRSRKTAAAQLDCDFSNESGEKGWYTQASPVFVPNNPVRAYTWLGDYANRVLRYTGLFEIASEHRDAKGISMKAVSRTRLLLTPHIFLTTAPQDPSQTGAVRTEDNGVYLNRSPEYIANDVLDRAGWPSADRDIAVSGVTIPEYDLSSQGQWLDQIVGTDRLTTIAGWDYREDAAGVIHLGPSTLQDVVEPSPDWTFTPGVNVMAFDHQADDQQQVTRVQVTGPMTSTVAAWNNEWSTSVLRHPVGMMYVAAESAYIYAIDALTQYLSQIRQSDRVVVDRWYLGGSITYYPGGLTVDEAAGMFYVLDTDWVFGGTSHAKVQKYNLATKAHVASYSLPDGDWSAIKTDGTYLWLTNYGDGKLYRRTLTATASANYSYAGRTQPTGLYLDGTTIGIRFTSAAEFALVDTSAPGTVTGTQSTTGTNIFGGEADTTTHTDLYVDFYDGSAGDIEKFALTMPVTTDVVAWAYDQALEDALGLQAGVADRVHDLHPGDAAHPFDIRTATISLRTINSLAQAQAVADQQLFLRKRLRRVMDLATTGHPGVEIDDVVAYPDPVAGTDTVWMVDTLREQMADTYVQTMSVLPWEAPA